MSATGRTALSCRVRLSLSLSSLAVLAACGGGEESPFAAYLPDFDAPGPVDISVLTEVFAIDPDVMDNLDDLLGTAKYTNTPAGIAWINATYGESVPVDATQDPLRTSGAAFAHATGLTGAGQIIAFTDAHVSENHESIGAGRLDVMSNGPTGEHGTSVVSVAMGNSTNFTGVAPGATGIFGYYDTTTATAVGLAAATQGAVAWNNSWTFSNIGLDIDGWNAAFGDSDGQDYLDAVKNYASDGVMVFAVSNSDTGVAGLMDGLPVLENDLESAWIAAANGVPTFDGDSVSSVYLLSSPCYESARWCIVADGSWKAATGSGSSYANTTGSSFAAPQVSGALALLAEAFPGLTPHELRIRLLASAEDDFFEGDDTVELADGYFKRYSVLYGHGFLDIEAALNPIGPTATTLSEGKRVATASLVLHTGTGLGNAVEASLSGTNIAVEDSLGAGFRMSADGLAATAAPRSHGRTLLAKTVAANLSAERHADPGALADPFASLIGPMLRLTDPDGQGSAAILLPQPGADQMGIAVSRSVGDGETRLELGLKYARDGGTVMSLGGNEAANMASVSMGILQDIGETGFMSLSAEMGVTDLGGATTLTKATTARFNAIKLTVGQSDLFASGDRLTVGLGLPVAVTSGSASANLPVLREGAAMGYEDVALDLAPEDRQIDLELTYLAPLNDWTEMKLSLIRSENFGNRAGVQGSGGAIGFAIRF